MAEGTFSRRHLLKMAGLLSASAVASVAGFDGVSKVLAETNQMAAPASANDELAKHQWFYVIDLRYCDGCDHCTQGCQKAHYLPDEQTWIKVYKMKDVNDHEYYMPRVCMNCENAPCVKACPVGASFKSPDGLTLIDQSACIGCRMCMAACPYEARYFNWNDPPATPATLGKATPEYPVPQTRGTVGKCVLCVHNLRMGKIPACVESCDMGVLYVGDLNTDLMTNGRHVVKWSEFQKTVQVVQYKAELGTHPRVFYVPGHGELLSY